MEKLVGSRTWWYDKGAARQEVKRDVRKEINDENN